MEMLFYVLIAFINICLFFRLKTALVLLEAKGNECLTALEITLKSSEKQD